MLPLVLNVQPPHSLTMELVFQLALLQVMSKMEPANLAIQLVLLVLMEHLQDAQNVPPVSPYRKIVASMFVDLANIVSIKNVLHAQNLVLNAQMLQLVPHV